MVEITDEPFADLGCDDEVTDERVPVSCDGNQRRVVFYGVLVGLSSQSPYCTELATFLVLAPRGIQENAAVDAGRVPARGELIAPTCG